MNTDLDKHIRALVVKMNSLGLHTYALCDGHSIWQQSAMLPCVTFKTDSLSPVQQLCGLLRNDSMRSKPQLNWSWDITAGFDANLNLAFRLSANNPPRSMSSFDDRNLIADFMKLESLIDQATCKLH